MHSKSQFVTITQYSVPGRAVRRRPTDTRLTYKYRYLHFVLVVIVLLVQQVCVLQGPFLGLTHRVGPSVTSTAKGRNRAITCKQQARSACFRRFIYLLCFTSVRRQ